MQGQQEPKLLALVALTLANLRSPLHAAALEDDSPCSPGLGQQMPLEFIPLPTGKGRATPSVPVSSPAGIPASRDPIAYLVRTHPNPPASSFHLVAWFLLSAFYISHS